MMSVMHHSKAVEIEVTLLKELFQRENTYELGDDKYIKAIIDIWIESNTVGTYNIVEHIARKQSNMRSICDLKQ